VQALLNIFLSFPQGICVLLAPVHSIPVGEML
jgi:hypothetical protein